MKNLKRNNEIPFMVRIPLHYTQGSVSAKDINTMDKYQKELINVLLYDKTITHAIKDSILLEIRRLENWINQQYNNIINLTQNY
jgi:hypothetical protein